MFHVLVRQVSTSFTCRLATVERDIVFAKQAAEGFCHGCNDESDGG
jgi:hypothetical protein